jgi:hypothetical protein
MAKLKYLAVEDGRLVVRLWGKVADLPDIYECYSSLGEAEGLKLLETLDSDIQRLVETADIVEQLAGYIFRGKYRKRSYITGSINQFLDFRQELILNDEPYIPFYTTLYVSLLFKRRLLHYASNIDLHLIFPTWELREATQLTQLRVGEATRGLIIKFLDELADIFENRDIRFGWVEVYSQKRRFRPK